MADLASTISMHTAVPSSTTVEKMNSDLSMPINIDEQHSSSDQGKGQIGNTPITVQSRNSQGASVEISTNETRHPSDSTVCAAVETNRETQTGDLECNDEKQAGSEPNSSYVSSESINPTNSEGKFLSKIWWNSNMTFYTCYHVSVLK